MTSTNSHEARPFQRLRALDIETLTVRHEAVYTVAQARQVRGGLERVEAIDCLSRDKKRSLWQLTVAAGGVIDLQTLAQARSTCGGLSFTSADRPLETRVSALDSGRHSA
jgi:Ala-tRNA(Pro) deacylase